jgi:NitT/TauT family transport system ATP-binding protein
MNLPINLIEDHYYNHPDFDPKVFKNFQKINKKREEEKLRTLPILKAENIKKEFNGIEVIPDLNFVIDDIENKSEIIAMLGPSGCGKSTILNLIAGLIEPTGGKMLSFGREIQGPGMDRGMIFQKYSSFPFLNVIENIAYPLVKVKKIPKKTALEKAKLWVDKMYLTGAEYKYPNQLSGGMQQRVAIARTLCMDAKIILMDEPFGALDRKIRWEMQDLIAEILFSNSEQEFTVLLVTHDIPEAVFLGDRIWIISGGRLHEEEFLDRPSEFARIAQGRMEFSEKVAYFNEKIDKLESKENL